MNAIDKLTLAEVNAALINSGYTDNELVAVFLKAFSPSATYEAIYLVVYRDNDTYVHDCGDVLVSQDANGKRTAEFV